MNKHIAQAKDYIAKGEDYYRKAAEEIVAAKAERPELTWGEIGRHLGRSESWVRRLVTARGDFLKTGEFEVDHESGSNKRAEVTRETLRKAEPEAIREIIRELPDKQKSEIVRAAFEPSEKEHRQPPVKTNAGLIEKFQSASFDLWKLQDELKDAALNDQERVRLLGLVDTTRRFLEAIEQYVETGDFDEEVAALLAEATR